ncbi:hypothetical protein Esti_003246 [Eimeria stiedai]
MEGRFSDLTAAIDSGDFRQALRLANQQLLRAQKQLHADPAAHLQQQLLVKSIKVIILVRQRKTEEALELLRQLPRDDPDLDYYLCIAYKELRNENRLSPCRVACLPTLSLAEARDEVRVLDIFSGFGVNSEHFQQDVLRLYGTYRKPHYLLWALVAALVSTHHLTGRKRLQLAQQLLRQLPLPDPPKQITSQFMKEPRVNIQLRDANAALIVRLSVLRQCNSFDDALDLLKAYQNCCLQAGEYSGMRIQLLIENGKIKEALQEAEKAMADPELETQFIGAFVRLAVAQGEEATTKAFKKLQKMDSFSASAASLDLLAHRGLELMGGHDRLLSERGLDVLWKSVRSLGDPVEGLYLLLKDHGHNYCAFRFFRENASRFTNRQKLQLREMLLDLRPEVFKAAQPTDASHNDLRKFLTIDKCLLALGEWETRNASSAARIAEWRRLFLDHCKSPRKECLVAEFIGMSVEVFLRWDREAENARGGGGQEDADPWVQRRFLFEALSWIDAGLNTEGLEYSPLLHQMRYVLGFVLGNYSALRRSFVAMDIKQSLLLSLGLFETSLQADYALVSPQTRSCRMINDTREDVVEAYCDYLSSSVEEGGFSWIPEYRLWGLLTQHALDVELASLQGVLCQVCEAEGRGSAELLVMPPQLSASLPEQLDACALRAAAECSEPMEWWATAAAVSHPSCTGPFFGGYASLTSKDLGPACISIERQEAVCARELAHPVRRSLQLHKARRSLEQFAKEKKGKESKAATDTQLESAEMDGNPQASGEEAASAAAMMEAAFDEEEKALFASWVAGLHPKVWQSVWPSRLLGGQGNHLISRHEIVKGPPQPVADRMHCISAKEEVGVFKPWVNANEAELLAALNSSSAAAASVNNETSNKRQEKEPGSEQESFPPHSEGRNGSTSQQDSVFVETSSRDSESQTLATSFLPCESPGAFNEVSGLLRRSIPGRIRRLRLLFAVLRPSAEMRLEQTEAIERLQAELQQVLRGSKGGLARPAWPSASSRHTEPLKTAFCSLSSSRLLTGLYSHQLAALDAFNCAFTLPKNPHEPKRAKSIVPSVALAFEKVCILVVCFCPSFSEFVMCCCTSVLDTVGELKGLGRPPLAEKSGGIRFAIFDALFGLGQASTVSLLLLLGFCQQLRLWHHALTRAKSVEEETSFSSVLAEARPSLDAFITCMRGQHKSLVEAMETASQLEPIGRPPWEEASEQFPYNAQGDVLMDQARQRTRSGMSTSYIETAIGICKGSGSGA